jgi:hypothetical protein
MRKNSTGFLCRTSVLTQSPDREWKVQLLRLRLVVRYCWWRIDVEALFSPWCSCLDCPLSPDITHLWNDLVGFVPPALSMALAHSEALTFRSRQDTKSLCSSLSDASNAPPIDFVGLYTIPKPALAQHAPKTRSGGVTNNATGKQTTTIHMPS